VDTSKLQNGDRIEVNVRGQAFDAVYLCRGAVLPGWHHIAPQGRVTYHFVTSRQIVKKLESGVGA